MALTTQDKLGIANIGLSGLSGLLGGLDNSDEKNQELANQRYNDARDDEFFQALLSALQNQSNTEQDISSENMQRAMAFANANPLGAEYNLRKGNNLFREGLNALGERTLARGTPNIAAGFTSRPGVSEALSDSAVNEAINQRRIATAGIDPRASAEIGGTNGFADRLFGELQNGQNERRNNAQQAFDMIGQRRNEIALANAQAQEKKDDGPGFWKKLGGALLPVAGIAANFIPGVGPVAGTLISAAAGAGGGALSGGKKGALIGGALGTAGSIGLNKAGLGQPKTPTGGFEGPNLSNFGMLPGNVQLNGNMGSSPARPFMQGVQPKIQESLTSPLPQLVNKAMGRPAMPSVNSGGNTSFNFGSGLPQSDNGFSGRMSMFGNDLDLGSLLKLAQTQSTPDAGRFSDAKIGGYGAPMNLQASKNFGDVAGPGMNTSVPGALALMASAGQFALPAAAAAGSSPQMQRLVGGVNGLTQRLLGNGSQSALPGLPQRLALPPSSYNMGTGAGVNNMGQILLNPSPLAQGTQARQILARMSPTERLRLLMSGVK